MIHSEMFYNRYINNNLSDVTCLDCYNKGFKEKIFKYYNKNIFDDGVDIFRVSVCKHNCNFRKTDKLKTNCKIIDDFENIIELNNEGFRSDDFVKNHYAKHILFVGCSNTFGVSSEKEKTWPSLVFNEIKQKEKVEGYYNLSHIGAKISENISNIFLYCKKYGKPNVIFFLMPTAGRELFVTNKNYESNNIDPEEILIKKYFAINTIKNYYFMLEEYCKSNNITLISTTWDFGNDDMSVNKLFKEFDTFFENKIINHKPHMLLYNEKNNDDLFSIKAKDGLHFGNAVMYSFSKILYNKYKEINENIRH